MNLPCSYCGTIDTEETRRILWDLYDRLDDGGKKYIEPLVYTQSDFEDMGYYDEEDYQAVKMSMERNMADRGLCPECGLPDLRGYTEADFLTPEEARANYEYYAEVAAERRMGC